MLVQAAINGHWRHTGDAFDPPQVTVVLPLMSGRKSHRPCCISPKPEVPRFSPKRTKVKPSKKALARAKAKAKAEAKAKAAKAKAEAKAKKKASAAAAAASSDWLAQQRKAEEREERKQGHQGERGVQVRPGKAGSAQQRPSGSEVLQT